MSDIRVLMNIDRLIEISNGIKFSRDITVWSIEIILFFDNNRTKYFEDRSDCTILSHVSLTDYKTNTSTTNFNLRNGLDVRKLNDSTVCHTFHYSKWDQITDIWPIFGMHSFGSWQIGIPMQFLHFVHIESSRWLSSRNLITIAEQFGFRTFFFECVCVFLHILHFDGFCLADFRPPSFNQTQTMTVNHHFKTANCKVLLEINHIDIYNLMKYTCKVVR